MTAWSSHLPIPPKQCQQLVGSYILPPNFFIFFLHFVLFPLLSEHIALSGHVYAINGI